MRVEGGDVPGSLGKVTRLIGELGGNIVEVYHHRWFHDVPVRLTQVDFLIETLDQEASQELIDGLEAAGIPARRLSPTAMDPED